MRARFSKLISVSYDEELLACQDTRNERPFVLRLASEFRRGIDTGVDLAAQLLLTGMQRPHDILEGHRTNHHDINIARATLLLLTGIGVPGGDYRIVAVAIVIGWAWASLTAARLRAV